ncbi:MAG TPA: lipoprotein [Mucilaginibacter sp.]|jgi:hypothetical protein|nr:lipoprotein [Mucilaginibacter sp.]
MKKIFLFAFAAVALAACSDVKKNEKALLDHVIQMHDSVMTYDEQLMHNKMKLDTLIKTADDTTKAKLNAMIIKLGKVDGDMEEWMQKFDPAPQGKSHEYIMNYMNAQKIRIGRIDSMMRAAIKESGEYIKQKTATK